MKIEIKNRYNDKMLLCGEYESIKDCLEKNRGANLVDANLRGADLRGANLGGANLEGANLRGAYLGGAYLGGVNLRGAYLGGAYLGGVNLRDAYLGDANLRGANLRGAKDYYNSIDFAVEIIRRQQIKFFTPKEWQIIGQIVVYRLCWENIRKDYKGTVSILKKLDKLGYGEYLKEFEWIQEQDIRRN
jgi:hypothetical protein